MSIKNLHSLSVDRQSMIRYLSQVLGIRYVTRPSLDKVLVEQPIDQVAPPDPATQVYCLVSSPLSKTENELLTKMMSSIGIGSDAWTCWVGDAEQLSGHLNDLSSAKYLISFSPPLSDRLASLRSTRWLTIFHPRELIENPDLKRAAWQDLKKVQKEIQA